MLLLRRSACRCGNADVNKKQIKSLQRLSGFHAITLLKLHYSLYEKKKFVFLVGGCVDAGSCRLGESGTGGN